MEPKLRVKAGSGEEDPRRALPSVDRLSRLAVAEGAGLSAWAAASAARVVVSEQRERVVAGHAPAPEAELLRRCVAAAQRLAAPHPRLVVNATGIVLHTNLGRAPLAPGAASAVAEVAASYSDLELDLGSGRRGQRLARVSERLVELSGAEAAFAVNNNAAAILLVLNSLALGREVVVSRGELVEIGGSFRVPEIMQRAGVRLVEIGSTNRTHPADYERALGAETALLLKVHRSNFELRGFVAEVGLPQLAELGRARGLPVVEDLGSGTLVELPGLPPEVFAPARLRQGADLVCFSGDKLLGGPQAGIVLGRSDLVAQLRSNPLARALRLDKLSLAALDWTLGAYLEGRAKQEIPVLRQLCEPLADLEQRARALAKRLGDAVGVAAALIAEPQRALVGGGSVPGFELDSWVVAVEPRSLSAERVAAGLREAPVPVLARVRDDRVLLDVRTLLPGDTEHLSTALAAALAGG